MKKFKLKKGDQVMVTAGKDKGKTGEILEILRSLDKVKVSGVNIVKKHRKPSQETPGKIEEIELPVHISNVSILDPKTGKPTRIKYVIENGEKKRFAVSSNTVI
tara:strand:- start:250 stop:561 length:312 start_codon:yes stop_codon:yes gene_type:complete